MPQINSRKFAHFILLYLLLFTNPSQLMAHELTLNNCSDFDNQIKSIKNEKSSIKREIKVELMKKQLESGYLNGLTVKNIDDISSLLKDDDDLVRFWAAASLGHIGPKAARAIPALKVALAEVKVYYAGPSTGVTSASAICVALSRISVGEEPKECEGE